MPGSLEIFEGLFSGLDRAASNIYSITQAQQKQKQDKELFDLKKKQYGLDIQKAEYEMSPEKVAQKKKMQDVELKREQAEIEERRVITENRKSEEVRKKDELGRDLKSNMRFMQNFMPEEHGRIMDTEAYAGEGRGGAPPPETGATGAVASYQPELFEPPPGTDFEWEMGGMPKVKSEKEAKGPNTQERARERIEGKVLNKQKLTPQESKLYYGYQEDRSVTLEDLENSFGIGAGDGGGEISLPSDIKTTTEARDWLMDNKGMTNDEAIDWIRSQ